jgi:hypothetical protein
MSRRFLVGTTVTHMQPLLSLLEKVYLGAIVVIGVAWIVDLPQSGGIYLVPAEWMGPLLGVGIAASYLRFPYGVDRGRVAGCRSCWPVLSAIACWTWMSMNYNEWIIDIGGYTATSSCPASSRSAADGSDAQVGRPADHDPCLDPDRLWPDRLPDAASVPGRKPVDTVRDDVCVRRQQRCAGTGTDGCRHAGAGVHHAWQADGSDRRDQVLHGSGTGRHGAQTRAGQPRSR